MTTYDSAGVSQKLGDDASKVLVVTDSVCAEQSSALPAGGVLMALIVVRGNLMRIISDT